MQIFPSLLPFLIITSSLLPSPTQSHSFGFTTNLIHRDSPLSPYYNSSKSYYEILSDSISRSVTRSSHIFTPTPSSSHPPIIQTPLTAVPGEYLMKISVGTPPRDFLAVADTGSVLTWIQCKPCAACFHQRDPLFDPEKSSTYKKQNCQSKACQAPQPHTTCDKNICKYIVQYGDGSLSTGDLSLESFTFGSPSGKRFVFPNVTFGCGHHNTGSFDKASAGIVGLGNSYVSIVNQLSDTTKGRFSHCMVPLEYNVPSKISFGSKAIVSGSGAQTTPIFTKDPPFFYNLNLKGATIGATYLEFETEKYTNKASDENGNIIIDSGTTITFLPADFYQKLEDAMKSIIPAKPVPGEQELSLCYKNKKGFKETVPNVTFHFTGADWELGVANTMLDMEDGVLCLAMLSGDSDFAIFGNVQQMNYLVGYDLDAKTLSFKRTDCRHV